MKKRCILPLLLAALLLAACGQQAAETPPLEEVPPAANSVPEAEGPESPEELPEGAAALTAEEIERVNEAFAPDIERVNEAFAPDIERDGVSYVNPLTCLVSCYYRWPEELDLSAFLRHFSPGAELSGETEFQALKAEEGWRFGEVTQEQMMVPIHKYLRSDVDAYLEEYMGITTEDLTLSPYNGPGARKHSKSEAHLYLPEYKAYYNFVSDMAPGWFACASGWYSENAACLMSDTSVLTLKNQNGSWYFRSFLPLRTE